MNAAGRPRARPAWLGLALLIGVVVAAVQLIQHGSRERLGAQVAAAARPGDIRMISSVTCIYCAAARAWFTENRVPFSECLVERDPACDEAYRALNAPGTPVMLVRGERVVGFDREAIAKALTKTAR